MVTKHLKKAWTAYRKNFLEFLKAIIIRDGVTFSIILFGAYLLLIGFADFNIIWPFLLAAYVSSVVLQGGFVKMCYESLRGKTTLGTMFKTTKKRGWSLIGGNLLVAVVLLTVLLVVLSTSTFIQNYIYSSIFQLFLVFFGTFLVFVLFSFVDQAIVIDNKNSFKSLKKSVEIAAKSYLKMVYLFVIIFCLMLVSKFSIGLIPQIGQFLDLVISHFFIIPLMIISLTNIYVEGKRRR